MASQARIDRRMAEALLRRSLPKARELARMRPGDPEFFTETARTQARYFAEENFAFVEINRGELGGWLCDVKLKSVPAGVADCFGTPVRSPWPTRQEAEAAVPTLLANMLAMHEVVMREAEPLNRSFDYFGIDIPIPESVLTFMEATTAERPHLRYPSDERALERLNEITDGLFGAKSPTVEDLQALDRDRYAMLLTVLAMSMLEGFFRFPAWPAEPVGKHPPFEVIPPGGPGRSP
jgi:hypothetical protein